MRRFLIPTIALLFGICFTHLAQAQTDAESHLPPEHKGEHIRIVLLSSPTVRHECRVHSATEDAITCGVGRGRKPITYQAEDIAVIFKTHPDPTAKVAVIIAVTAAACLAGSFFVPAVGAAILLRVLAGLSLPVLGAIGIGDNPEPYQDTVDYLRSGYRLSGTTPELLEQPAL